MRSWSWLVAISTLLLAGCASLEHQSDLPDKKPLPMHEATLNVVKKWKVTAGRGVGKSDGRLLLAESGSNLVTADHLGNVVAIDAATGVKIWTLKLKVPASAGPSVGDGKLVIGTSNGKVIAIDARTGKLVWTSVTTSEVLAAPRISGDMVFIHTMDGGLSALSMNDGRQFWRFTHNLPPLVLRRSSTPIVADNLVLAGFSSGKLIALRKQDGTIEWSQDVAHPKGRTDLQRMVDISADPVIADGIVYAASYQGNIVAYKIATGQVVWDRELASYAGFALDNKFIYVAANNGDVLALDQKTGHTFWVQPGLQGRILSSPALMGNYIVLGDDDGLIHWIDKNSGKLVGRYKLDKEGVEATPIVNNNIVYILGRSGKLVALTVN